MAPARGLSFLFPAVPVLCVISSILLLMLLPSFWKTRIIALLALVAWLLIGNMLVLIGTIGWRGNIHDAPIFADIITQLWGIWFVGAFGSMATFSKFVWLRLRPSSARELYDHRRRNNIIDACITILVPLLWVPMFLISCSGRYYIIEDIGPAAAIWLDWPGFFLTVGPMAVPAIAMIIFNVLAVFSYRRLKRANKTTGDTSTSIHVRTKKLLIFSLASLVLALFAIGYSIGLVFQHNPPSTWGPPMPLAKSIAALKTVRFMNRFFVENLAPLILHSSTSRLISMPLIGMYVFAWFGFSTEARKSYLEVFMNISRLLGIKPQPAQTEFIEKPASRWPAILAKLKPRRKSNDILPTTGTVEPFALSPPNSSGESFVSKPEEVRRSDVSEEVVDIRQEKRRRALQNVVRRLSVHKPPTPANTATLPAVATMDEARRLSFHKPPLPLSSPADASTSPEIATLDITRRLSFHKPPLPPSTLASASTVPVMDSVRRLSFHKPPFPSFVPVNASALPAVAALDTAPQTDQNEGPTSGNILRLPALPDSSLRPPPSPSATPSSMPPTYQV